MSSEKISKEKFVALYGNVKLKFVSYWKYTFSFTGVAESGDQVTIDYGGNSDNIYRFDVTADKEITLKEFHENEGFDFGSSYKDGQELYICY